MSDGFFAESDPKCSTNPDLIKTAIPSNENVTMTCTVAYSGNWAPEMEWRQVGGPVITTGVVTYAFHYKRVSSSLTVLATKNVAGRRYSCTASFVLANKPANSYATNLPDYSYPWVSPSIDVYEATIPETTSKDDTFLNTSSTSSISLIVAGEIVFA